MPLWKHHRVVGKVIVWNMPNQPLVQVYSADLSPFLIRMTWEPRGKSSVKENYMMSRRKKL